MSIASSLSHHCVIVLSLRRVIAQSSSHRRAITSSLSYYRINTTGVYCLRLTKLTELFVTLSEKKHIKNVLIIKQQEKHIV